MAEESLPRVLAQRYRLDAKIGAGGMGEVYRASDLKTGRLVAVKLVRAEQGVLDEEIAGRFVREAHNTARIQQENIVEFFEFGRSEQGDLFIAMELLEGESLSQRMRRVGKISPEATVRIAVQICAALAVAHQHGLVHRDLKPANIMLVPRNGTDFVKVLDFGVAKATGPSEENETQLTQLGMLVGTIEYMSPEQLMSLPLDGRADVYSLGVVLYRMLAATPPYRDGGAPAIIHSHLNLAPKPVRLVSPEVPLALERVVMTCLAKRKEDRFTTMTELGRALADATRAGGSVAMAYDDDDDDDAATRVAPALMNSFDSMPPSDSLPPLDSVPPAADDKTMMMVEGNPYAPFGPGGQRRPGPGAAPLKQPTGGAAFSPHGAPRVQSSPAVPVNRAYDAGGSWARPPGAQQAAPPQGLARPPNWSDPHIFGHAPLTIWQRFLAWIGIRRAP